MSLLTTANSFFSLSVLFCFVLLQLSLPDFGPEGWNAMGQGAVPRRALRIKPPALTDSSENAFETPFQKGILFAFKDYSSEWNKL